MDEQALAKSNPKEDIQSHTDELLKNLDLLKLLYPQIKVNWNLLYLACIYHDLGKINEKFQIRIKTGKHWSLSLSSPITLLPMYYNEGITILTNPPSPEYDIWVENVGLMFGLKYRFD